MTCADPEDVSEGSPLVRAAALHSLVEQLGTASAAAFVERFVRLWPARRQRLHGAVEHRDAEAAQDAALSLKSSASMAGAHRLAELGSRLHADVPTTAFPAAWAQMTGLMVELDRVGDESVAAVARLARDICPGTG